MLQRTKNSEKKLGGFVGNSDARQLKVKLVTAVLTAVVTYRMILIY